MVCLKLTKSEVGTAHQNTGRVTHTGGVCESRLTSLTPERPYWSGKMDTVGLHRCLLNNRSETYLSLSLFGTDNAGALPWHDSHLASGKRRPLTSLSTAGDKRDGSHITYQTIYTIQYFVLIAIRYFSCFNQTTFNTVVEKIQNVEQRVQSAGVGACECI